MTKRASEGRFGAGLRQAQLKSEVWKPADDMRNWKPCDYIMWVRVQPLLKAGEVAETWWWEVKDTPQKQGFPKRDIRPSQWSSASKATYLGIPYMLAVWWRELGIWTISDMTKVVEWFLANPAATSIPRVLLMSRFGVDTTPANLSQTIKLTVLEGLT